MIVISFEYIGAKVRFSREENVVLMAQSQATNGGLRQKSVSENTGIKMDLCDSISVKR
ncbi:hypothetical protein VIC_001156 [Vibrio coralliilyticus ATCC BAA-450]|nr:hypothetical protein VIC_001156 [Vibrio coralliilyticus ATCC BAA-450]